MDDEIIATYCLCDDLLKAMHHQEDRQCQMHDAEIMTTALVASLSLQRRLGIDTLTFSWYLFPTLTTVPGGSRCYRHVGRQGSRLLFPSGSCWIPGSWMCRWRTTRLLLSSQP